MKIVVTGSLGNISKPLTKELIQKGHAVTVISSKPEKQKEIEALGATAAIGTLEDAAFLTTVFTGADAVYCMTPPQPSGYEGSTYDRLVAENYVQAIRQSGVKRVVHLSSYGANLDKGTGPILGRHLTEQMLNKLPGIALTHMRPTYFYYNLYNFIGMIKNAGVIRANYGGDDSIVMVSPVDIAAAIAKELVTAAPTGSQIQYVASDELTGHKIASILGAAVGKPDLKWIVITDEQMQNGLTTHGVPAAFALELTEMYSCLHSGELSKSYYLNKPAVLGNVKLTDFAKDFATAYKQG